MLNIKSILETAYEMEGGKRKHPARWDLRKEQVEMIKQLSDKLGMTQIATLRSIVDDWRITQLKNVL